MPCRPLYLLAAASMLFAGDRIRAQDSSATGARTLVAVVAHPDDEGAVSPLLARYAREGVRVHLIIATDGGAATGRQGAPGPEGAPSSERLVERRSEEARCAATALGIAAPILLGFPDGKLGDFGSDRALVYRLTQRVAEELARLRPDVVLTWGPEGGVGHPDHRIVSSVVTQLQRADAPGVPERVFYMYLPVEGIRSMNQQRGVPPLVIPQARYFTVRVAFEPADLKAAERSMHCHRSQFTAEVVQRVFPVTARAWNGTIALVPAFATAGGTDLFR